MPRYFAFLRAINVGGHVVRMETLRDLFTSLGFSLVETFINSGNVIFQSKSTKTAEMEKRIATHLESSLGYPVPTFLRTDAELAAIARHQGDESVTFCVGFVAQPLTASQREILMGLQTEFDTFRVDGREIYWQSSQKQSQSKITNALLERKLKIPFTFRNVTTVTKLLAKYP